MASYRYNSIKFPLENLRGVDADAISGLRKFIAARETELNTIKTSVVTYDNGPFCGHPIEISDHSPGLLPLSVKGWVGSYDLKGKWHGTTGEPLIVDSREELSKQSNDQLGKGYEALGDLFAELGEDPADRAISTPILISLTIGNNGQDDYGYALANPKRHGVWSCEQRMMGFAFTKSGKRTKQAIYKTTCTPHTGTDDACNFMDDFGSLVGSRPLESELFITVPVVKQMAVYTIGRTSYKINVTPQSANNLKSKILAKKRFFADKNLSRKRVGVEIEPAEQEETESLGDRFEAELAKRKAAREALASQDVAQVVAQAVAVVAIDAAMAQSAEPELCEAVTELATCEAGESEANAPTIGASTWTFSNPAPSDPMPAVTKFLSVSNPTVAGFLEALEESNAAWDAGKKASQAMEIFPRGAMGLILDSAKLTPEFKRADALNKLAIERIKNAGMNLTRNFSKEYAEYRQNKRDAQAVENAAPIPPVAPSTPPVAVSIGVEGVARSNLETEDEKRKQWQGFAHDIPASLAISAYNGVSMSPERRGASAQNEYGQTMAADYETMRAQATKGGTLDLLPEVFARYRSRQSSAYKAYLSSSSRCVSSFIAGPANFPAARMNKRSDIAHKRLGEYLNGGEMALQAACRTLRPDLRAIMAGDVDAIDRLTVDISSAERTQDQMKAANKAIRTNANAGEAHQVAALMELGHSEAQALELLHPRFSRGQGFPSYRLTNNQANIRRMRERLEKITAAKARPVETVECSNGVTLEDDAPANRVRLFFPGKPSDEIRAELKSSGFRWAPSSGAWQAYRNRGTLSTAKRLAGEVVESAPILPEEIQGGMGGSPVQIENDDPAIEAPTIAQEIAAIDAPIVATVDAQTTPDTLESFDIDGDGVSDELCEAIDKATAQQVQALTDAQFSKLYDHLENWNFHTENYMLEALRLGDVPIIDDMRQITIDQKNAGYLRGDINNRRIVITDRMKALKEAQDAPQVQQASEVVEPVQDAPQPKPRPTVRSKSGIWHAWLYTNGLGLFGLEFIGADGLIETTSHDTNRERMQALTDLGRAADSLPPTPPKNKEGWEGSPVQNSKAPEGFKMTGPIRVDLAALITQGVKPEALVGLGVYYRGDMANPSDSGAITGFSHSDFYGLVVDVTMESGQVWRANRTSEFKDGSFSIDGKMHGAPYMAQLSATVATLKASASSAAEQAAKAHATALIDLAAQFPQLKRAENTYAGGKLAAVNARILLKAAFKGVKFSVKSDCNSMRLEWADGPTDAQVCEVVGRFDIGEFDAYTDYHSTSSTAFSQLFGGVQYMTTRRTESDELVQMAIDQAFADAADKPTLNDWHKGTNDMGWGDWKRRWVSDALKTISLFSTTKSHTKA